MVRARTAQGWLIARVDPSKSGLAKEALGCGQRRQLAEASKQGVCMHVRAGGPEFRTTWQARGVVGIASHG